MPPRILIVDDDQSLAEMVADYLRGLGYAVDVAFTGDAGIERLRRERFDALILDVMLPDLDGFEVCRRVRAAHDLPILMLTARGEEIDRIVGLELGADDYLPKPFNPRELAARLKAILRRRLPTAAGDRRRMRFGRLEIDLDGRTVQLAGENRSLTSYQFDLLVVLAENAGRVMSREALMEKVRTFRLSLERLGFTLFPSQHPAIAVQVGHATVAQKMTDLLYQKGTYALGFCHPVVPEGTARIRAQITIAHTDAMLETAAAAFAESAHGAGAPLFATPLAVSASKAKRSAASRRSARGRSGQG